MIEKRRMTIDTSEQEPDEHREVCVIVVFSPRRISLIFFQKCPSMITITLPIIVRRRPTTRISLPARIFFLSLMSISLFVCVAIDERPTPIDTPHRSIFTSRLSRLLNDFSLVIPSKNVFMSTPRVDASEDVQLCLTAAVPSHES